MLTFTKKNDKIIARCIEKNITDMYNSGVMRLHLAGGESTLFPKELNIYVYS